MSPKKILIFSLVYYPQFIGGAEVAIKEITDRLGQDFEFDLVTVKMKRGLPAVEKIGAVQIYRIGVGVPIIDKLLSPFLGAIYAAKLNRKNHYTYFWAIMVTFISGAPYILNIFRRILGRKRIPIILTLQEGDSEAHLKRRWAGLIHLSWRMALKRTAVLTSISGYLQNRARKLGYSGESFVVPNGVDTTYFNRIYSQEELDKLKNKLQKKENDVFLITTSRLVIKNAIHDVISSLKFLPDNIKFIIIGTGNEERNLQKFARTLDVDARVKFLGFIDHKELPKYLKVSDIFIRPSLSEGFGNSFVEAMAAGIPVIATPVGGIVDFLFDPDKNPDKEPTGLFVKTKDPRGIAKQVVRLLENPALRQQIILSAHKMVVEKYDWDIVAKDMKEKVFQKVTK